MACLRDDTTITLCSFPPLQPYIDVDLELAAAIEQGDYEKHQMEEVFRLHVHAMIFMMEVAPDLAVFAIKSSQTHDQLQQHGQGLY